MPFAFGRTIAPSGTQRLGASARGHSTFELCEKIPDLREHRFVLVQFSPQHPRDDVSREIVRRRTETAGRDDEIGAREPFARRLLDVTR